MNEERIGLFCLATDRGKLVMTEQGSSLPEETGRQADIQTDIQTDSQTDSQTIPSRHVILPLPTSVFVKNTDTQIRGIIRPQRTPGLHCMSQKGRGEGYLPFLRKGRHTPVKKVSLSLAGPERVKMMAGGIER